MSNTVDPRLEAALRQLEVTANNFAIRLIRMADVRTAYVHSKSVK